MADPSRPLPTSPREQRFNELLWHLGVIGRSSETGLMLCGSAGVDWFRLKQPDLRQRHDGTAHD